VDIYLPDGIRGLGYCEDAVAFTKCTLVEIEGALYKED